MHTSARDSYLESQVRSATPQRLRLMLLEAAVRFLRQSQQAWQQGNRTEALANGDRARQIVSELFSAIKRDESELARRVFGLYAYLYQTLASALLAEDAQPLEELIQLLDYERETWRQVCERLVTSPVGPSSAPVAPATGSMPESGSLVLDA